MLRSLSALLSLWGFVSFRLRKLTQLSLALLLIGTLAILPLPVDGASKKSTVSTSKTKKTSKKTAKKVSKKAAKCDPNYSSCVPVASDVDCKPGNGNGPKYFTGTAKVLKKDIYGLDRDKDGIACEKK